MHTHIYGISAVVTDASTRVLRLLKTIYLCEAVKTTHAVGIAASTFADKIIATYAVR
jgi:hypothetical protein